MSNNSKFNDIDSVSEYVQAVIKASREGNLTAEGLEHVKAFVDRCIFETPKYAPFVVGILKNVKGLDEVRIKDWLIRNSPMLMMNLSASSMMTSEDRERVLSSAPTINQFLYLLDNLYVRNGYLVNDALKSDLSDRFLDWFRGSLNQSGNFVHRFSESDVSIMVRATKFLLDGNESFRIWRNTSDVIRKVLRYEYSNPDISFLPKEVRDEWIYGVWMKVESMSPGVQRDVGFCVAKAMTLQSAINRDEMKAYLEKYHPVTAMDVIGFLGMPEDKIYQTAELFVKDIYSEERSEGSDFSPS